MSRHNAPPTGSGGTSYLSRAQDENHFSSSSLPYEILCNWVLHMACSEIYKIDQIRVIIEFMEKE